MSNWNSLFFLNHRLSSLFPCDFVFKYDDDQWPNDTYNNEKLINITKNNNLIVGRSGFIIPHSFCGYFNKYHKHIENRIVDHASVPLLVRPGYFKLDARHKIFRLYGAEDVSLSLNSFIICNVIAKTESMKLTEKQNDKKNHRRDNYIAYLYRKDKEKNRRFRLFFEYYCYLIHAGYVPKKWDKFQVPKNDSINIVIEHKRLY